MDLKKLKKVSKILNGIRGEAYRNSGKVTIIHGSKEWDAVFFAESFLDDMTMDLEVLDDVTRQTL